MTSENRSKLVARINIRIFILSVKAVNIITRACHRPWPKIVTTFSAHLHINYIQYRKYVVILEFSSLQDSVILIYIKVELTICERNEVDAI